LHPRLTAIAKSGPLHQFSRSGLTFMHDFFNRTGHNRIFYFKFKMLLIISLE
jgi:hypothetical protein